MAETANPILALSRHTADLIERVAPSVVAIEGGGRWPASGIHWRPGVVVTAEERLERDAEIAVVLAEGRRVTASLAGRDPSTDVAVLRFEPNGNSPAATSAAAPLRPGELIFAIGSHEGAPVAHWGMVSMVAGAWHSLRGGTIDNLLRLDMALGPASEGGALVDASGTLRGMVVFGPRRRVLAIPTSTIERAVDQILAKGHVPRGYLGAGLQRVRLGEKTSAAEGKRGLLVVSLDPNGPAARAGLIVGDIIIGWNSNPVGRLREVVRLLGPESVGKSINLELLRGGAPTKVDLTIGERPLA